MGKLYLAPLNYHTFCNMHSKLPINLHCASHTQFKMIPNKPHATILCWSAKCQVRQFKVHTPKIVAFLVQNVFFLTFMKQSFVCFAYCLHPCEWNWMQADKSLESHNFCFLFGGGPRQCPGKEFGMFLVSSFLHYFATRYRFAAFLYCLIDISGILYASTYILFFLAVLFGQSESFAKASILFADGSKSKKQSF